MKFETRDGSQSEGWCLAQALVLEGRRCSKGHELSASQARLLAGEAIQVFKLDPGDVDEDQAAARLRGALFGAGLNVTEARTGRVNALAQVAGLVKVGNIQAFNGHTEALTLATLPALQRVSAGDLVATLKVIPFALEEALVEQARPENPLLSLMPFLGQSISLIQTQPRAVKPSVLDKARAALDARLGSLSSPVVEEQRIAHDSDTLARTLEQARGDIIILFPGAATQDRRDVGPLGLTLAGGEVHHLGMPVDPGNLLFLGAFDGRPVIGAPGCARSVAYNGFDWILERVCAGAIPTSQDIQGLGLGGLLKEIPSRPLPRLAINQASRLD